MLPMAGVSPQSVVYRVPLSLALVSIAAAGDTTVHNLPKEGHRLKLHLGSGVRNASRGIDPAGPGVEQVPVKHQTPFRFPLEARIRKSTWGANTSLTHLLEHGQTVGFLAADSSAMMRLPSITSWAVHGLVLWFLWVACAVLIYSFLYPRSDVKRGNFLERVVTSASPANTLLRGHFDCFSDSSTCFWATICPSLRWADTINMFGFLHFWPAFHLYILLALFNYINFLGLAAVSILTIFCAIYYRREVAEDLGLTQHGEPQCSTPCVAVFILVCGLVLAMEVTCGFLASQTLAKYMETYGIFFFGIFTTGAMLYFRQKMRMVLDVEHGDFRTCFLDCCFLFWCPCCAIAQEARVVQEAYATNHPAVASGPASADTYGSLSAPTRQGQLTHP